MKAFVIDSSLTVGFLLKDEFDALSLKGLATVRSGVPTFVPAHWAIEVANALLMAERRKRSSQIETQEALLMVQELPLTIDGETASRLVGETTALARQYGLTIYDAAYLELAMRQGATLATTDRDLAKAARAVGVALL